MITDKNKKRTIEISEKECEVIRNLIWDKVERLENNRDNLDDHEYGVICHIKIGLLESLVSKYFYE